MSLSKLKLATSRSPSSNLQQSRKNDWSTYHLYTMRKSVEEKGKLNSGVREQLKMQRQNSQKILSRIQSSMLQTQQTTVDFLSRYQQQKHKNQQLQALVTHYMKQIQQQKLQKHQNVMQNIQNNEYDEMKNIIKEREKQLQTVTNKLNSSQCEKNIKYEVVKAQRRQRILFSNQFNNFQNEIFDLEDKYKQFLIERVLLEKIYDQQQFQMTKTRLELEKKLKSFQYQSKKMYDQQISRLANNNNNDGGFFDRQQSRFIDSDDINSKQTNYFMGQTLTNNNKQTFYRSRAKINYNMRMEKNQLTTRYKLQEINEKKISNLQSLKVIKQLLNQFGVGSFHQLKKLLKGMDVSYKGQQQQQENSLLQKIHSYNDKKTEQIEKLQDEIYQWSKKVDSLEYDVGYRLQLQCLNDQSKTKRNGDKANQKTDVKNKGKNNYDQQIQQLINQMNRKIDQQNQSIKNFNTSEQLQTLINFLEIDQNQLEIEYFTDDIQQKNTKIDTNLFALIQEKFTQIVGNNNDFKNQFRAKKDRRSIVCWQMPHLQQQQKDSNLPFTQKSICPLLQPAKSHHPTKRMKTGISQQVAGHNGLKKLSNLLKNQSKTRGPIDIVSKDQMIKQAQEAFDKQGIVNMEKFQVKYT